MSRGAECQMEIDRLGTRLGCLWQMREGTERLLETPHRLAVGRPLHSLLSGLPAVR